MMYLPDVIKGTCDMLEADQEKLTIRTYNIGEEKCLIKLSYQYSFVDNNQRPLKGVCDDNGMQKPKIKAIEIIINPFLLYHSPKSML